MPGLRNTNPWFQAVLLGAGLFAISLILRVAADTLVDGVSAGPAAPDAVVAARDPLSRYAYAVLIGVLLPAVIETPFVVWVVRRVRSDTPGTGLAVAIAIISAAAWLLHGPVPGLSDRPQRSP